MWALVILMHQVLVRQVVRLAKMVRGRAEVPVAVAQHLPEQVVMEAMV